VAEASAAMFSGKIRGLEIARELGHPVGEIPPDWFRTAEILRSRPGDVTHETVPELNTIFPVLHCSQEIPCNPCTSVCPQGNIFIAEDDIREVPDYIAAQLQKECTGCEKCVNICPGLAITLVDMRKGDGYATVSIPYEFGRGSINRGDVVTVVDTAGVVLGNVEVSQARLGKTTDRTILVKVQAPHEIARRIAGIQVQDQTATGGLEHFVERLTDDLIVCRCERVTLGEIKAVIQSGVRDLNEIKALTRAGMGARGSQTCNSLIKRAFRELGVPAEAITDNVGRPLFVEVPFGVLAGVEDDYSDL
jgi:sarcosine oxidase, subunit alpha